LINCYGESRSILPYTSNGGNFLGIYAGDYIIRDSVGVSIVSDGIHNGTGSFVVGGFLYGVGAVHNSRFESSNASGTSFGVEIDPGSLEFLCYDSTFIGSTWDVYGLSYLEFKPSRCNYRNILLSAGGEIIYQPGDRFGTYQRVGQPVPLTSVTGTYWRVSEGIYATGSLSVFAGGSILIPVIDFQEQFAGSGTFQLTSVYPTGTAIVSMWGKPFTPATIIENLAP